MEEMNINIGSLVVDDISRFTPACKAFELLIKHKCVDVTDQLDLANCSEYPLARGGSGIVYRGMLLDGTQVALKCIEFLAEELNLFTGAKAIRRAAHETYAWSKCVHQNVLPFLGMAQFRGYIAMVSPWMENGSLQKYGKNLPLNARLQLCVQVVDAVSYLHANGMVHGDIKAANFVVSDDGAALLNDYGNSVLSKYTLFFSKTTSVTWTLRWTAPEVLKGISGHTAEADVYALGMTLLEILSGQPPFHGMLEPAVAASVIANARIPPRSALPGDTSYDSLWMLLERCWRSDPIKRPNAAEVKDEITRLVEHWSCDSS